MINNLNIVDYILLKSNDYLSLIINDTLEISDKQAEFISFIFIDKQSSADDIHTFIQSIRIINGQSIINIHQ